MKTIPLRDKTGTVVAEALVDDADFAWLNQRRWSLGTNGYAIRSESRQGRKRTVRMARQIMGVAHGDPREVDHKNRNTLDNRRANLRVATHSENSQNRASHRGSASRFRGVYQTRYGRWMAQTRMDGRLHYHGTFEREEDAAAAASAFRAEHMPFAVEELVA